jgi:hypothetical protein
VTWKFDVMGSGLGREIVVLRFDVGWCSVEAVEYILRDPESLQEDTALCPLPEFMERRLTSVYSTRTECRILYLHFLLRRRR